MWLLLLLMEDSLEDWPQGEDPPLSFIGQLTFVKYFVLVIHSRKNSGGL